MAADLAPRRLACLFCSCLCRRATLGLAIGAMQEERPTAAPRGPRPGPWAEGGNGAVARNGGSNPGAALPPPQRLQRLFLVMASKVLGSDLQPARGLV